MQKSKPLTLRRNFSWTFIGNGVYAACQWAMVMVLTKLGNPEMVGQFTLGFAITAPVIMFTSLHLRSLQATDAKKQYAFADYLGLRLIGTIVALVIILGIVLTAGYRSSTALVIVLVGVSKAFESLSDIFYGLIQQNERMDRIALSMMIKGPLSLLLLGIGVYLTKSVLWGVVGLAVAWGLALICFDIRSGSLMISKKDLRPRWQKSKLRSLLVLSLPLGFVMMLNSLYIFIPRYLIEGYLGEHKLGIFSAISYFVVLGSIVVSALGESASPRLAKYYADGNAKAFRGLILKLMGIGISLGAIAILISVLAGKFILTILYEREYAEYANLLIWLMVGAAILYTEAFMSYGMSAARYFLIQLPLFSLVIGVTYLACIWLIPIYGLTGAALALIVGSITRTFCTAAVICHALFVLKRNKKAAQSPNI